MVQNNLRNFCINQQLVFTLNGPRLTQNLAVIAKDQEKQKLGEQSVSNS